MQQTVSAVENDAHNLGEKPPVDRDTMEHVAAEAVDRAAQMGARFVYGSGDRPLDGFTLKRGIGHGGFGEVYQASSDAGKEVAVKLVRRNLDIELRGIRQCLNLKHPNLVAVYDIRQDRHGDSWVVMDHVAGPSLEDELRRHPHGLPIDEALAWFFGIAAAVAYLHDHGVVHRDLKPGNIFRDEGVVKVGDYGLSKFISSSRRSGHTESIGTVHYMAPEVANGRYGQEIDVYALGVILYEMLTGNVPFEGESIGEVLMKHLTAKPDLARLVEPYRGVVARALEKDPRRRYASVAQMVAALPRPGMAGGYSPYVGPMPDTAGAPRPAPHPHASPDARNAHAGPQPRPTAEQHGHYNAANASPGYPPPGGYYPPYRPRRQRQEPLLAGIRNAWNALTTPLQVVVVVAIVIAFMSGGFPLFFMLGVGYGFYYVLWLLLGEACVGYSEANAELERHIYEQRMRQAGHAPAASRPVEQRPGNPFHPAAEFRPLPAREAPPIRRVVRPTPDEIAAAALREKPFSRRIVELLGSMLAAAVASVILTGVVFISECLIEQREAFGMWEYAGYLWLCIVATVGSWCVLIPAKFWEGVRGDTGLRWMTMILFGLGLGLFAAALSMALLVDLRNDYNFFNRSISIFGRQPVTLFHTLSWSDLAYHLAGFGLLFAVVGWWRLANPLRKRRIQLCILLIVGIKALLLAALIGWPQPWLLLAALMIGGSTQIAALWIPESQRALRTFDAY